MRWTSEIRATSRASSISTITICRRSAATSRAAASATKRPSARCTTWSSATDIFSILTRPSECSGGRASRSRTMPRLRASSWPPRIPRSSRRPSRAPQVCGPKCRSGLRPCWIARSSPFHSPIAFPRCRNFFYSQKPDILSLTLGVKDESSCWYIGTAPYVCHTVGNIREHHPAAPRYAPFSCDSRIFSSHLGFLVESQPVAPFKEDKGNTSELLRAAFVADPLCHMGLLASRCLRYAALGRGILSHCVGRAGFVSHRSLSERNHILYARAG